MRVTPRRDEHEGHHAPCGVDVRHVVLQHAYRWHARGGRTAGRACHAAQQRGFVLSELVTLLHARIAAGHHRVEGGGAHTHGHGLRHDGEGGLPKHRAQRLHEAHREEDHAPHPRVAAHLLHAPSHRAREHVFPRVSIGQRGDGGLEPAESWRVRRMLLDRYVGPYGITRQRGKRLGFRTSFDRHWRQGERRALRSFRSVKDCSRWCSWRGQFQPEVHKKLRSKRLAPVLIKEITRRVNRRGLFQAAYTAGVVLPKPVARCRYWHRSLNPKKLIEIGFSRLAPRMTMTRTIKLYALPDAPQTRGLRQMREGDCETCCAALNTFLKKFTITPQLSLAEFKHWMLTQQGVVYSYVVEDPESRVITDMVSFYALPSSVLGNDKHRTLHAAYSYYYFHTKTPLQQLMTDALILAKRLEFDVFNALDILHNEAFLKELKFGIGDGHLQYYMYNWRCANVKPNQVGLVLL